MPLWGKTGPSSAHFWHDARCHRHAGERGDQRYRLVDTAGIRKKKSVDYGPEFFGINRAFQSHSSLRCGAAGDRCLDGVTEQDQKLAGRIEEDGRACVIVVNKWDAVEKDSYTIYDYDKQINCTLYFIDWAKRIYVSALTGQRVPKILDLVDQAVEEHRRRVTPLWSMKCWKTR
jgi:GTP-binding protein